jgi:hypothetical protein
VGKWRNYKTFNIERVVGCGDYFEKGCVDIFNSKFVKHFTDNQNVERISEVGSMKKDNTYEYGGMKFWEVTKRDNMV